MLSYITAFSRAGLRGGALYRIPLCAQGSVGGGGRVPGAVQFSGKNTGPEPLIPLYPWHAACLWVSHRSVPWLTLVVEK